MLLMLYAASGVTALAYEVLWTRMLSLMFGVSIFGVVITVAAFMLGLGAGSLYASRHVPKPVAALRWFALLEGSVALFALLLPLLMQGLDALLTSLASGLSLAAWQGMQGGASLALLMLPAMAMGAAFPMILRAAPAVSLGSLYGVNAAGAAVGAMLPLFLLPAVGWQNATWLAAGIGLLIASSGMFLSMRMSGEDGGTAIPPWPRPPALDLLAYAGIGAAALMLEVVWTRIYGMVLLRTEYVLAVLLAVFLLGIGIGSLLARRLHGRMTLTVLPILAATAAALSLYLLPAISQWANGHMFASLTTAMLSEGGIIALCTLPATIAFGAWLPLLARHFDEAGEGGGWWYGANSAGAALGALLSGFVLIPWLGSAGTLAVAAVLLLVCGMRWAQSYGWIALPLLLALLWPVHQLPEASRLLPALTDTHDLYRHEDAVSLTHVVAREDGQRLLLSDLQRMDASSDPTAVAVQKNQARLPLLLHPHPRSMLFLGLGTGITSAGSLPQPNLQRTAVELSQGAIIAAREWFAPVNDHAPAVMHVVRDDARRFLRLDTHHYDVIIGDLFHPDMAGRANLLSLQQFRRAYTRLNDGGIFVQWLALNQFDIRSMQVVMQTFRHVFPAASVFVDGYRMALVGCKGGHITAGDVLRHAAQLTPEQLHQLSGGEGVWTWLGRYWGEIPPMHVPLQDEWAPVIEFSLPKVRYGGGMDLRMLLRWLFSWRIAEGEARQALAVPAGDVESFARAYATVGLNGRLWLAELSGREDMAARMARMAWQTNPQDRWAGFALADRMFASLNGGLPPGLSREEALTRILAIRPDHTDAIRAMIQLKAAAGDAAAVHRWRRLLHKISPLARDAREE